jgi:hypothetical protein
MKRFLLIAGDGYYPQSGDGDWVGMFETREEAEALIQREAVHEYYSRGPRKGQIKSSREVCKIFDREIDWHDIIDLENWSRGAFNRWNG